VIVIKEFKLSEEKEPVPFKIGTDIFHAVPPGRLPANVQIRYAEHVGDGKLYEAHRRFFRDALEDASVERFMERLDSKEEPITLHVMAQVANWLLGEVYSGDENPTDAPKP
jgi:hypothetical protein